jgi:MSHA pilin protein MshD
VDDYSNFTASPVADLLGSPVAGLGNYSISPAVAVVASTDLTGVAAKKITVSVTGPGGVLSISGYRSNY